MKKSLRHILWNFEKSPDSEEMGRYHFVVVDDRFIRPTETGPLVADPSKAKKVLGWTPRTTFKDLVHLMVDAQIARLK